MVKIVRSAGLGAVIIAASVGSISATSLNCNPVTITEANTPLTVCNPAYGGPVDESCTTTIEIPNSERCAIGVSRETTTNARSLRRMEDASNSDVAKLEAHFGENLELDFTTLKEQYSTGLTPKIPWPSSYWPTYQDSINVIWKSGGTSASAKYAAAYGLDPVDFMNKISADNGIDSRSGSTKCSSDADCVSLSNASVCAKRKDATSGYCTPTWYGICHAWAPAALLEDEPTCDVVKNGQTFHVMDIKALITDVYDNSAIPTVFTGARFNGPDNPVSMDSYGRYTDDARRDLGAGFFHIAMTNILGKYKQSFIVDVTAGTQVWNQPVRSYDVKAIELVDVKQASQQHFGTSTYPFNAEMVYLAYVKTTLRWVAEAYADGPLVSTQKVDTYTVSNDYEYLLELDANYAVIGGEWIGKSKVDHPDFLWFPTAKPDASTVTSAGLSYANVKELLELSVACGGPVGASTSAPTSAPTSANASEALADGSWATSSRSIENDSIGSQPAASTASSGTGDSENTSIETVVLSTTSREESSTALNVPIDSGYYTIPPTTNGQDLADDIDIVDTTITSNSNELSLSSQQETMITQTSVHKRCW